jgi:hypothetical protein
MLVHADVAIARARRRSEENGFWRRRLRDEIERMKSQPHFEPAFQQMHYPQDFTPGCGRPRLSWAGGLQKKACSSENFSLPGGMAYRPMLAQIAQA